MERLRHALSDAFKTPSLDELVAGGVSLPFRPLPGELAAATNAAQSWFATHAPHLENRGNLCDLMIAYQPNQASASYVGAFAISLWRPSQENVANVLGTARQMRLLDPEGTTLASLEGRGRVVEDAQGRPLGDARVLLLAGATTAAASIRREDHRTRTVLDAQGELIGLFLRNRTGTIGSETTIAIAIPYRPQELWTLLLFRAMLEFRHRLFTSGGGGA